MEGTPDDFDALKYSVDPEQVATRVRLPSEQGGALTVKLLISVCTVSISQVTVRTYFMGFLGRDLNPGPSSY